MGFEIDQTFASQQKNNKARKARKTKIYGKYKHDNTVGMHLSRYTEPIGVCMCLDTCCQDEGGCKCKQCFCKGRGHEGLAEYARTQLGQEESQVWQEQNQVREIRPKPPTY